MPKYASSTHSTHWIFDREVLASQRDHLKCKVTQQLQPLLPQSSPVQLALTDDEFSVLLSSLITSLLKVAKFCNLSHCVAWTAGNYLQRYYLLNSVYDTDPMQMMFTALFLASKSEEVNISLKTICESVKICEEKRVRAYEVGLLKGIRYQLFVFSPYRSLACLWADVQDSIPEADRAGLHAAALSQIESTLLTDWVFLESPAVIALAALASALHARVDLDELLQTVLDRNSAERTLAEVKEVAAQMKRDADAVQARVATQEAQFRSSIKKVMGIHKRLYRTKPADAVQQLTEASREA